MITGLSLGLFSLLVCFRIQHAPGKNQSNYYVDVNFQVSRHSYAPINVLPHLPPHWQKVGI